MKKLVLTDFSFQQNALIEASAGTGKTYTISNLYLRLLLGHKCQVKTVSQILVLTFTNAATAELKERILAVIRRAWRDFAQGQSDDEFVTQLLAEVENKEQACQRLLIAAQEMDLASVFTIHGFCQRVLTEYAFESGATWQEALLLDDSEYLLRAATDYWRKHVADLPVDEVQWILSQWAAPEGLAKHLRSVLFRDIGHKDPFQLQGDLLAITSDYREKIKEVRNWWLNSDISAFLADADLKANVKIAKPAFLQMMQRFARGELLLPDLGKEGWLTLSPEKVQKARKKSSKAIDESLFERFVELAHLEIHLNTVKQEYYFWHALIFVRQHLAKHKQQLAELSPDDLLLRVNRALQKDSHTDENQSPLVSVLREKYPIAMVDEFQDTDPIQFNIFQQIYQTQENEAPESALIMIGDPKQAIYSFRGGDIYTYLLARDFVAEHSRYTLAQNWRSQPALVAATNRFFADSKYGFMNDSMPFFEVSAGKTAKLVELNEQSLSAYSCRVLTSPVNEKSKAEIAWLPVKWEQAATQIAELCANAVKHYLNHVRVDSRPILAGNMCILVRDRFEADLIKKALQQCQIDSVFLLKDTVFKSSVTYSLLLLLNAINECRSEAQIKAVFLDELFAYSHEELVELNQDISNWQDTLEVFIQANEIWTNKGIMASVEFVFQAFALNERIKNDFEHYQRVLTDVRHLCEILQFQSRKIEGRAALITWFKDRVARPELLSSDGLDDTQWRLETDQNLVQICTIHASKGLQYPFVFIPFISRYKESKEGFFHDEHKLLRFNITGDENSAALQQQERLAEDIRLLYVALTRAELHCWLGLWDNNVPGRTVASGFAKTAFGKLLDASDEDTIDHQWIVKALMNRFNQSDDGSCDVDVKLADPDEYFSASMTDTHQRQSGEELSFRGLDVAINHDWRMSSYSGISRTRYQPDSQEVHLEEQKAGDEASDNAQDLILANLNTEQTEVINESLEMRFSFARGASPGSFLHEVLEHCDFCSEQSLQENCLEFADKFKIDKSDVPDIASWLMETLHAPLQFGEEAQDIYCLTDIQKTQRIAEMEFYLPLNQVNVTIFNQLISDWLPDFEGHYQIHQLNGMLKGYLDLVYIRNGQLYVADYKSNFLGAALQDYQQESLHHAMLHHDYYLQALLYTLAMHRYLRNKLNKYNYQQHIGGAQYLFLRGMTPEIPGNGVLTIKPPQILVERLDTLFAGTEIQRQTLSEEFSHV